MSTQRGYTVVELLIASAVMLAVLTAVTTLLHDGLIGLPVLEEAVDLHQRTRVAVDAIATDLRNAGTGGPFGPLADFFAALLPRLPDAGPAAASPAVLTVVYAPPHGGTSRLLAPLSPGTTTVLIEALNGCPVFVTACGFNANTRAVLFDDAGHVDFVSIDAIGPGMLTIRDLWGGRSTSYDAGSHVAEVAIVSYTLDTASRQLRRTVGASMFPLADNVTTLSFEYLSDTLSPIPLSSLTDGPFRGAGLAMFDDDLRSIRTVRVTLRLETGVDQLRGADTRLFARPGTAGARRLLPDVATTFDVTPRNGATR